MPLELIRGQRQSEPPPKETVGATKPWRKKAPYRTQTPKTAMKRVGNEAETAKHHLNPSSGTAKNTTFGGSKTAPLEPP